MGFMGKSLAISSKGLDFDSFMKAILRKPLSLKRLNQLCGKGSSYHQPLQGGRTTTKSKPKKKTKEKTEDR
jgi:hypothetical protein